MTLVMDADRYNENLETSYVSAFEMVMVPLSTEIKPDSNQVQDTGYTTLGKGGFQTPSSSIPKNPCQNL